MAGSYDDRDGNKRYVTEVVVDGFGTTIKIIDKWKDQGGQQGGQQAYQGSSSGQAPGCFVITS